MKAIVEAVLHVTSLSTSLKLKENVNVIIFNSIKKFQGKIYKWVMWCCILLSNTLYSIFLKKIYLYFFTLDDVTLSISMLAIVKVINEVQIWTFKYLNVALKIGSQQIFKVLVSGFKFDASARSHMQMSWPLHE